MSENASLRTATELLGWRTADPPDIDNITGVYVELRSHREADIVFSPMQFDMRVVFSFNSDMTFDISYSTSPFPPFSGTFEVERITLDEISPDDRQHMQDIDKRIDAGIYRISARNSYGYRALSDSYLELYVSRVDDSDIVIYWPAYKETIYVRKITSVDKTEPEVIRALVGSYTEIEKYCVEYGFLPADDQRIYYVFNPDTTFRLAKLEDPLVSSKGIFRAEQISIYDIAPEERSHMPNIYKRAEANLYHVVLYGTDGVDLKLINELFISRISDSDIVFYFPILEEAVVVLRDP